MSLILPDDLYFVIFSFLNLRDTVQIVSATRGLSERLLKRVRQIRLFSQERSQDFISSKQFRERVLQSIHNPLQSLGLRIHSFEGANLSFLNDFPSLSYHELRVYDLQLFHQSFLPLIDQVNSLTFENNLESYQADNDFNELLSSINSSHVNLKQLTLVNYIFESALPVISSLESLTLRSCDFYSTSTLNNRRFSHLKRLILEDCRHLEDVSAFDGIHELHLIRCPNIRNISSLKHNYKIQISFCSGIPDYRGSCQFSTIVQIDRIDSRSENIDVSIMPSSLQNVKSLQLQGNNSFQTIHGYLPIETCLNLRFVSIISYKYSFLLPSNHNIKEIIIEECARFESCMNMKNITKISLRDLENLKNLTGLEDTSDSNSYRSIEVNSCPNITDFTPLQSYQKISIFHCKGFSDTKIFPNVKEFHLKPYPNIIFNDYLYVTHLIFNFPPNNLQYKKLNQVQVIEINHSTDALIDFIMDVQRYLYHIQKIITKYFLPFAHFDYETVLAFIYERLGSDFIIQEQRTSGELILLRKKK